MSYQPRIETNECSHFITTRTRNSEMWFVNNRRLEDAILGYAAKYRYRYNVKLYALAIQGNHIHSAAYFPDCNRAPFMRDFNSQVAKAVPRYVPEYPGGRLWGRRYSSEFLPDNDDVENWFFYTVLQSVQSGLVEKISEFPGYNCFHDAVWNIQRQYKVFMWAEYNAARRYNKKVKIDDYTQIVHLKYERLPGYEHLTQEAYAELMHERLEERRLKIVEARHRKQKGFAGRKAVLATAPGAVPYNTKTSDMKTHRPRVLSVCDKVRAEYNDWYFTVYFQYKEASLRYRSGELEVSFPPGTYKPYVPPPHLRPEPPPPE